MVCRIHDREMVCARCMGAGQETVAAKGQCAVHGRKGKLRCPACMGAQGGRSVSERKLEAVRRNIVLAIQSRGVTTKELVARQLEALPEKVFNASEVSLRLKIKMNTAAQNLHRLSNEGRIVRIGIGQFQGTRVAVLGPKR